MLTGSDQSPARLPPTSTAGVWPAAEAAALAAGPFLSSLAQFAPAFSSSLWSLWLTVIVDPFGLL